MNALLGEAISLVAGVATGFAFERRATRDVKQSNNDLQRQISALKTSIGNLGGHAETPAARPIDDLTTLVTKRAIATQSPDGKVDRRALIAHFAERDIAAREIDAAISSICRAGIAKEEGFWLQMA